MNTDPIKSSVLQEISSTELTPKWQFVMHNVLMWSLAIGTIAVGAIAVSVMEHRLLSAEWELRHFVTNSDIEYIFLIIPYFWFGLFILLVALAYQELRHTKRGYKFAIASVILVSAGTSLLIGTALHAANIGETIEETLTRHIPLYEENVNLTLRRWHNPEEGRFVVDVQTSPHDNIFTVVDQRGKEWVVMMTTGTSAFFTNIATNTRVRILGTISDDQIIASYVLPQAISRDRMKAIKRDLQNAQQQFLPPQFLPAPPQPQEAY